MIAYETELTEVREANKDFCFPWKLAFAAFNFPLLLLFQIAWIT